jgi:molybdopterin-binding protein
MKMSARNNLKGTVRKVVHGMVVSEVTVELPGGNEVVAVITKASAENLSLAEGKEANVVFKATNVMIATE